jgi:outer membrane protein assembly factor BamB
MARFSNEPPEPVYHRSTWLLTAVLTLVVFGLLAALWRYYMGGIEFRFAPSPTPTATPASPLVATVDFRATMIAEDRATQIAYEAVVPRATPTPSEAIFLLPVEHENPPDEQDVTEQPDMAASATAANINLVPIGGGELPPPATPTLIAPDVSLPTPDLGVEPTSPLVPTEEPLPVVIETETPTPTETMFVPTETPTFTPMPTVFQVQTLRAYIAPTFAATTVWLRLAPLNTHTPVATLQVNTQVDLRGRDESGEWVYLCCVDNEQRWVRQVYAPPVDNAALPDNAPPSATPNDVRWLPVQPWPANFPPPPVATPIPPDSATYVRQDRANTGRLSNGLNGSLQTLPSWSVDSSTIPQQFSTPLLVVGPYVLGGTSDGTIYGFDRNQGNQTWTYSLGAGISQPMLVIDNILYVSDDSGRITAVSLGSNAPIWQQSISIPSGPPSAQAVSSFIARDNFLYVSVRAPDSNHHLLKVDRNNGAMLQSYPLGATLPQPLAHGVHLIYVAGAQLWALDVDNFELVWTNGLTNFSAPPVYAANGIKALSELIVTTNGQVIVLDAATGKNLHTYDGGGQLVTGIGLGDRAIFASGSGFIKAFDRYGTGLFWSIATSGEARGGPIVSPDQLLLVSGNGTIEFVHPDNGAVTAGGGIPSIIRYPPAISSRTIYIIAEGPPSRIYAYTQP